MLTESQVLETVYITESSYLRLKVYCYFGFLLTGRYYPFWTVFQDIDGFGIALFIEGFNDDNIIWIAGFVYQELQLYLVICRLAISGDTIFTQGRHNIPVEVIPAAHRPGRIGMRVFLGCCCY